MDTVQKIIRIMIVLLFLLLTAAQGKDAQNPFPLLPALKATFQVSFTTSN